MFSEYLIPATVLLGGGSIVAAIFTLPALTQGGGANYKDGSTEFRELVQQELSYCSGTLRNVDCVCFAQKSGHIMTHKRIETGTYTFPLKKDLARGQAVGTCS